VRLEKVECLFIRPHSNSSVGRERRRGKIVTIGGYQ